MDASGDVFVIAEYYGKDLGVLPIGNVNFVNNNARLGPIDGSTYANTPSLGTDTANTNLAMIFGDDAWRGANISFSVPTVAGHNYKLQLIFHDNWVGTPGQRIFGLNINGATVNDGIDLSALGAGLNDNAGLLYGYSFVGDGNPLAISITKGVAQNPLIDALTLKDLSLVGMAPVFMSAPASSTNYAGRTVQLSCSPVGNSPLTLQWQAGPAGSGIFTNLVDGGNTSGSTTAALTINNFSAANEGDYRLVASNPYGSTNSPTAMVRLWPPIPPGSSYPEAVMTYNPAAYWRLNDASNSTTFADSSPNQHDGAIIGTGATLGTSGPQSPAWPGLESNNTSLTTTNSASSYGQVTSGLNLTTANVTIMAWIYPVGNQKDGTGIIVNRTGNSGANSCALCYNTHRQADGDDTIGYLWNGQEYQNESGIEAPHNMWSLAAVVITPTNATVYLINPNGLKSKSFTANHAVQAWNNNTQIGVDTYAPGAGQRVFQGSIDEAAVLPLALDQGQLLQLYGIARGQSTFPPQITTQPKNLRVDISGSTPVNGSFSATAFGDQPMTYQWQARAIGLGSFTNLTDCTNVVGSITNILAGSTTLTLSLNGIVSNNVAEYQLAVTNAAGFTTTLPVTLTIKPPLAEDGSYAYVVNTNGPVGYWRLNEPAGSPLLADSSPSGQFDGYPQNGTNTTATLGVVGPQPSDFPTHDVNPGFDSANTAIATQDNVDQSAGVIPTLNISGNITITAWIKPTGDVCDNAGIVFSHDSGRCGINYGTLHDANGNNILEYTWNNTRGDAWNSGLVAPANEWSFIALVVNGTTATLYCYNDQGLKYAVDSVKPPTATFKGPTYIGADSWFDVRQRNFTGSIDEVAIFNKALSTDTLLSLYGRGIGKSAFPPSFAQQPLPAAASLGGTATFTAAVSGTAPYTYQWQASTDGVNFSDLANNTQVSGATTTTLILSNVSPANAVQYRLRVSNSAGSVISASARLLLIRSLPPSLLGQWFAGDYTGNDPADFADKSGFTPGGVHDAVPWNTSVLPGTPQVAPGNVPPGFSPNGYSLFLDGYSAVMITNTANTDGDYRLTFDDEIKSNFTIAFWASGYPNSSGANGNGWNPFVSKSGESAGWSVRDDNNLGANVRNPTFTMRGLSNDDAGNGAPINLPSDFSWHHYVGVFDGKTGIRQLWVDGVQQIHLLNIFGGVRVASGSHLVLGALQDPSFVSNPKPFYGLLYDVRMYNYALSASEIQALLVPTQPGVVTVSLAASSIPAGQSQEMTVSLPTGTTLPVTVYLTNNAPGIATIRGATGNVFSVTFTNGGPTSLSFILDTVAPGAISFSLGNDAGLGSVLLGSPTVTTPRLIGQWFTGSADLSDKSGYASAGTHDGFCYGVGGPVDTLPSFFSSDVPPGFTGSSLALDGNYLVCIHNSSTLEGGYQPTFDANLVNGFSAAFWAKGVPNVPSGDWATWIGKRGEDVFGWKVRAHLGDGCPAFTLRDTTANDDNFNSATRIDANWHHYIATWDSFTGLRKLYVDGKLDFIVPNDFGPLPTPSANYLTIGGYDNNAFIQGILARGMFIGKMFDVRMYNYALTASEAQALAHPTSSAIVAAASQPVIDQGETGTVSVTIPASANATAPVTLTVTNVNPGVASIAGATGNVLSVTFDVGAYPTRQFTLTGLSEGQAIVSFSAPGLAGAWVTNRVYAPNHLIGRWFAGAHSLADVSGFNPGKHDGVVVGTAANLSYVADAPPGFGGVSVRFNNANNASTVAVLITNSAVADSAYAPTFDNVMGGKFTITCWAKLAAPYTQGWVDFLSKRGENNMGWHVRRSGGNPIVPTFTVRGSQEAYTWNWDDVTGSIDISSAGVWRHIAAVWDGYAGTRQLYVNGVLDPSINKTGDFGPYTLATGHHVMIGDRENSTIIGPANAPGLDANDGFNGELYDVRIYNHALSAAEVNSVMTTPDGSAHLSITVVAPGVVQLSWPVSNVPYVLQTCSGLTAPVTWSAAPAPTVMNGQNVVTIHPDSASQFFRLY